ncbi:BlaI/MecI/CopY family transcriptional regulator [Streptomyces sp. NPDC054796]
MASNGQDGGGRGGGRNAGRAGHAGHAGERRAHGRRRGQGELEAQVLSVLRTSREPETAAWVQSRLGGDLAYTTVVTILTRLHAKQIVHRTRVGRSYVWSPAADEAGLAAQRMRRVLDSEADRDAVLTSFVSSLSPEDERLMRALLRDAADGGGAAGGPGGHGGEDADGREA